MEEKNLEKDVYVCARSNGNWELKGSGSIKIFC
jgi:hypothetical protein